MQKYWTVGTNLSPLQMHMMFEQYLKYRLKLAALCVDAVEFCVDASYFVQ